MDPSVLLPLLGKAVLGGIVKSVAERTTTGLIHYLRQEAKREGCDGPELSEELEVLLSDDRSFWKSVAGQFKPTDRKGVVLLGPSGAGKTTVYNYLVGDGMRRVDESTAVRGHTHRRSGWTYSRITDTPGTTHHAEFHKETLSLIKESKAKVLLLVMADGLLCSGADTQLKRPGRVGSFPTRQDLRKYARGEENVWLEQALAANPGVKKPVPHLMLAMNKLDHWSHRIDGVTKRYTEGEMGDLVRHAATLWCGPGSVATLHPVSSWYDSFYGKEPRGEMSTAACELSLRVLRAELRLRLMSA